MVGAPNIFSIIGGPTTVSVAIAVLPVPPLSEVTVTLLFFTPIVVPVTLTENVQDAPAASVAPLSDMLVEPGTAVIVPPSQEPTTPAGVLTTRPAGSGSLKLMPARSNAFGFMIVKVTVVLAPNRRFAVPN